MSGQPKESIDLPVGWCISTVGEVATYVNGLAFKPGDWGEIGLPIIRIQNLTDENKHFNFTNKNVDEVYIIRKGNILVSWSATLGVFTWNRQDAVLNQHIFKVIPNGRIVIPKLLVYLLKWAIWELTHSEHLHGSTMKHINRGPFLAHPVKVPPYAEQQRIVDKIEELFSDLDNGIDSLKKARQQLKVYRQAVLKWAFEGKLTAQWREEQERQGKLESADTLLAQIKAEREQRYQKELEIWQAEVEAWHAIGKEGKKPRKPSSPKDVSPLSSIDLQERVST